MMRSSLLCVAFLLVAFLSEMITLEAFSLHQCQHSKISEIRAGRDHFNLQMVKPGSYAQRLEEAMLRKSGQLPPKTAPIPPPPPSNSVSTRPKPTSTPSSSNNLPFSDEMYEHLKVVISKLTTRMKSSSPLTKDEVTLLKTSVAAIIDDLGITASVSEEEDGNNDQSMLLSSSDDEDPDFVPLWQPDPITRGYAQLAEEPKDQLQSRDDMGSTGKLFSNEFKGKNSWQVPGP